MRLGTMLMAMILASPCQLAYGGCGASRPVAPEGGKAPMASSSLFGHICHGAEAPFFTELARLKAAGQAPEGVLDFFGLGPLHWAASLGRTRMVEALVEAKFSPNQLGGQKKRWTPLHSAIKGNHLAGVDPVEQLRCIRLLVENGKADLTLATSEGDTALQLALKLEKADIAAYLRERMVPEAKATGTDGPAGVS